MHLVTLTLVGGLLLGRALVAGAEPAITGAGELSFAYDDNALLGRRGQFLDSDATARAHDLAARQSIAIDVDRAIASNDHLRLSGRADLAEARTTQDLRGYDVQARGAYERALPGDGSLAPEIQLVYHRESPEWSYRALLPQLTAVHQLGGVRAQLRYQLGAQTFADHAGGSEHAKNSYANIDMRRHLAELDLRLWHGRRWRCELVADAESTRFAGNLDTNLADYAGLAAGTERRDRGAGITGKVLVLVRPQILIEPGARVELNRSNSDAYAYRAGHVILDATWAPADRHAAFVHVDVARYDFPHEQFDRRYLDTRRDFRRDVRLAYEYTPTRRIRITATYRRLDSASNDCLQFDPQRDELGLPVYSRSYSCFGQNRLETSVRFEL